MHNDFGGFQDSNNFRDYLLFNRFGRKTGSRCRAGFELDVVVAGVVSVAQGFLVGVSLLHRASASAAFD